MQIIEIEKLDLKGSILDVGSKKSSSNVSNHIKYNKDITYLDKYSDDKKDLKIDLEEKYLGNLDVKFNNIFLFNVLEHIYNFQNCINTCNFFLKNDGFIVGSTPFIFQIHGSPKDYFRFTSESLNAILNKAGFKNIKIKVLTGGIFVCFFSSISRSTQKIPLLNNFLFLTCQLLDLILSLFSKNLKSIFPLGYLFTAKK